VGRRVIPPTPPSPAGRAYVADDDRRPDHGPEIAGRLAWIPEAARWVFLVAVPLAALAAVLAGVDPAPFRP
jgi:hypothetical protein